MSSYSTRRRKPSTRRRIVWALLFVLVFAVGIALGQALEDSPQTGSTVTLNQTLTFPRQSQTVTVTAP
jgi:hypothetical protein